MRSAIPRNIKDFFKNRPDYEIKRGLVRIGPKWKHISFFNTKDIYNEIISNKIVKPTAITTLENNLNLQFEDHIWKSLFSRIRHFTS